MQNVITMRQKLIKFRVYLNYNDNVERHSIKAHIPELLQMQANALYM